MGGNCATAGRGGNRFFYGGGNGKPGANGTGFLDLPASAGRGRLSVPVEPSPVWPAVAVATVATGGYQQPGTAGGYNQSFNFFHVSFRFGWLNHDGGGAGRCPLTKSCKYWMVDTITRAACKIGIVSAGVSNLSAGRLCRAC